MTEEIKAEQTTQKTDTITIKKDALWKYSTFVLAGILVLGIILLVIPNSGNSPTTTGAVVGNQPAPTLPPPSAQAKVDLNKVEHIIGDPDAPVVLVEWTDHECPFCQRHDAQTKDRIFKEYVDTGRIRYGTEHFPLGFHSQAQKSAEATECAAKVGGEEKFWEMSSLLFKSGVSGGVPSFKAYAGQLGINQNEFDSCLDSGETAPKIQSDLQEGQLAGVRGTPGFAIIAADGTVTSISGAQPFAAFSAALDAAGA